MLDVELGKLGRVQRIYVRSRKLNPDTGRGDVMDVTPGSVPGLTGSLWFKPASNFWGLTKSDRREAESFAIPVRQQWRDARIDAAREERRLAALAQSAAGARQKELDMLERTEMDANRKAQAALDAKRRTEDDGGRMGWHPLPNLDDEDGLMDTLEDAYLTRLRRARQLESAARRSIGCGRFPRVAACSTRACDGAGLLDGNGGHRIKANQCEMQGCPTCEKKKSKERAERVSHRVDAWSQSTGDAPKFVTFTQDDRDGEPLDDAIARHRGALKVLMRSWEWEVKVQGAVVKIEWTFNAECNRYHVHSHALLLAQFWHQNRAWYAGPSSRKWWRPGDVVGPAHGGAFCRGQSLGQYVALQRRASLLEAWRTALSESNGFDCVVARIGGARINRVSAEKAISEVTKYVCKADDPTLTHAARVEIVRAILGKRLFETYGEMRDPQLEAEELAEETDELACPSCGVVFQTGHGHAWLLFDDEEIERVNRVSYDTHNQTPEIET